MLSSSSIAAQQRQPEYAVKAAYLLNFGKFAKWPSELPTFNICVLGKDPFGGDLDHTIAGEAIESKPIVIHRMVDLNHVRDCQILFLSDSERSRLPAILAQMQGLPVLTVSDAPDFVDRGGMIQFEVQNNRVRFLINLRAAREAKLNLGADLLSVASKVEGK